MTASKRYVPVSLVCLLLASTTAAMAGPSSTLDPYAWVQAPTAKELEATNNKARAKKGLPPVHKADPVSSTKVEDVTSSTTYVTAPGGGNGKAVKQNSTIAEETTGKKHFGKFPKIGLPSMPSLSLGKGKGAKAPKASSTQEPEQEVAKAPEEPKAPKAAKVAKAPKVKASEETLVGEEQTASKPQTEAKPKSSEDGNMVSKTLKATTDGVVHGSKKVGSGIASGAKASGNVLAKGASMMGSGFKATGEKLKGGTGKIATGMPHMPNPFHKKDKGDTRELASSGKLAGSGMSLGMMGPTKSQSSNSQQAELIKKNDAALAKAAAERKPDNSDVLSDKAIAAGASEEKSGHGMTGAFSKFNPFAKKGIAGKKQKQTL